MAIRSWRSPDVGHSSSSGYLVFVRRSSISYDFGNLKYNPVLTTLVNSVTTGSYSGFAPPMLKATSTYGTKDFAQKFSNSHRCLSTSSAALWIFFVDIVVELTTSRAHSKCIDLDMSTNQNNKKGKIPAYRYTPPASLQTLTPLQIRHIPEPRKIEKEYLPEPLYSDENGVPDYI
jgi:hypothetical protein